MDTLQVAGMISKELKRSGLVDKAPQLASNIAMSFSSAGLKLCDLKPLAELLGCEPEMAAIEDSTHSLLGALVSANRRSRTYNCRCVLRPTTTHTLLHAGELYREVTILLRTEQMVAWRTADGQEYSAKAHQVTLDPDEDGLAAALLTRIAGVEIAPEHMAELRAQMGVTHG